MRNIDILLISFFCFCIFVGGIYVNFENLILAMGLIVGYSGGIASIVMACFKVNAYIRIPFALLLWVALQSNVESNFVINLVEIKLASWAFISNLLLLIIPEVIVRHLAKSNKRVKKIIEFDYRIIGTGIILLVCAICIAFYVKIVEFYSFSFSYSLWIDTLMFTLSIVNIEYIRRKLNDKSWCFSDTIIVTVLILSTLIAILTNTTEQGLILRKSGLEILKGIGIQVMIFIISILFFIVNFYSEVHKSFHNIINEKE